jgi:hypothetical protein
MNANRLKDATVIMVYQPIFDVELIEAFTSKLQSFLNVTDKPRSEVLQEIFEWLQSIPPDEMPSAVFCMGKAIEELEKNPSLNDAEVTFLNQIKTQLDTMKILSINSIVLGIENTIPVIQKLEANLSHLRYEVRVLLAVCLVSLLGIAAINPNIRQQIESILLDILP